MTDDHVSDHDAVAEHDPVTHMDGHTALSDDDHGHAGVALGPIDWPAWGYAVLGAGGALAVLLALSVALTR